MYKVLLADDEILDLEGMKAFIPWNELGLEVVSAVNSGFEACDVLSREKIDILVTDVRMPNMSGIELAQRALQKQEDLRVIFVSGHKDFNYIKQAMSLNAHGYVLKPMDDQELVLSLTKVRMELEQSRRRKEEEEAYRQIVPIAKNEYMLRLLEAPANREELSVLDQAYRLDSLSWPVRVAVLEIDDFHWKLNPYSEQDKQSLLYEYYDLLAERLHDCGIEHICKLSKQRTAVLLDSKLFEKRLAELPERVKERFPFTITIGLGDETSGLQLLAESYAQALAALEHKMFRGKGRLLFFVSHAENETNQTKTIDLQLDSLLRAVAQYELVQMDDELSSIFRLISQLRTKVTIHNLAMYLVMKLSDSLRAMNENFFVLMGMELKNLDILIHFETIDDIQDWLRRLLFELSEKMQGRKQSKNGKLIQDIIQTVNSRLHENITLRDIACQYSFSPNYLGVLFKEETGRNFSDFVIDRRMEESQQLLKDTNLKIYEIAERVGYRYLPYFSRQFKDTTGMTPLEYRRKQ